LVKWIKWFSENPKKVFIVHWEEESSNALKERFELLGLDCYVPELKESIEF
jgi:metallo-beta-lactamase family protein